jgi:hypothetical protein
MASADFRASSVKFYYKSSLECSYKQSIQCAFPFCIREEKLIEYVVMI